MLMLDPAVLPEFLVAVVLVCAAPGPDQAFLIATSAHAGTRAGLLSAAAMAAAMAVHVVAAALGLGVLLSAAPRAMLALRLVGATYLMWLAISTVREALTASSRSQASHSAERVVARAMATNLTNPKIIVFFSAFLPQF